MYSHTLRCRPRWVASSSAVRQFGWLHLRSRGGLRWAPRPDERPASAAPAARPRTRLSVIGRGDARRRRADGSWERSAEGDVAASAVAVRDGCRPRGGAAQPPDDASDAANDIARSVPSVSAIPSCVVPASSIEATGTSPGASRQISASCWSARTSGTSDPAARGAADRVQQLLCRCALADERVGRPPATTELCGGTPS
jgi:hypothetical protein